jgi:predicted ATPase
LAEGLSHPFSLAYALGIAAWFHSVRREEQLARERAEAVITLSTEQGFPYWLAFGTMVRGWALAEQGQVEEGIAQMRQLSRNPFVIALLAEAYGKVGQVEEGLTVLAKALAVVDKTGVHVNEAELYRLKGELTLQKETRGWRLETSPPSSQASSLKPQVSSEAEACFQKAIEIARKQQAKSLELRAVMSLVRLRQQQAMQYVSRTTQHEARALLDAARNMLSEIYNWFTEGFDTKDLQEAKALLDELP